MAASYTRGLGLPVRRGRPPRAYTVTGEFSVPSSEFESRRGHRGRGRGDRGRGRGDRGRGRGDRGRGRGDRGRGRGDRGRGSGGGRFANRSYEEDGVVRDLHGPHRGTFQSSRTTVTRGQRFSVDDKDKSWNIRSLPVGQIVKLSRLRPTNLVDELTGDVKALQMTLQQSAKISKPGIMDTLVRILSKVAEVLRLQAGECRQQASQILAEAFSERCSEFHFQLKMYVVNLQNPALKNVPPGFPIQEYTLQHNVARLCKLFRTLLETLSASTWSCLPVDELLISVRRLSLQPDSGISPTLLQETQRVVELRDQMRQLQVQEKEAPKQEWDNSEYRELQILPKWKEVCIRDRPCKLRPNIIRGPYKDWLHYYDIQFRLLREDFVAPLRRGICDYLDGARGRKLQDVKLYHDVAIVEPCFTRVGICYRLQFDVSRLQHCNWEHSKRLLFGSLVCLSPDDFQRVIFFATISNREPQVLKQGVLEVQFEEGVKILPYCRQPVRFTMVESLAYFEASRHILRSLQTAEVDTMPFTKYLIENQCNSVSPPQYLAMPASSVSPSQYLAFADLALPPQYLANTFSSRYNLNCLYGRDKPKGSRNLCFDVCDPTQWPSAEEVELDQSQLKAIQMGLTQEIAVIQGPPGTGKTYIGQKIVEALLNNRQIWDPKRESPIVVMCFTNHALDQFLEGIMKQPSLRIVNTSNYDDDDDDDDDWMNALLTEVPKTRTECKVVRIGGRSQSELIQQFNIGNIRRSVYLPGRIKQTVDELNSQIRHQCTGSLYFARLRQYHTYRSCSSFPKLPELYEFMDIDHYYQLLRSAQTAEEKDKALKIWLGVCEVFEEVIIQESPESYTEYEDDYEELTTFTNNVSQQPDFPFLVSGGEEPWQPQVFQSGQQDSTSDSKFLPSSDSETEDTSSDGSAEEEKEEEEEEEEEKELIDIQGAAAFEEGARMLDEDVEDFN